jgi:hypothetical protein
LGGDVLPLPTASRSPSFAVGVPGEHSRSRAADDEAEEGAQRSAARRGSGEEAGEAIEAVGVHAGILPECERR